MREGGLGLLRVFQKGGRKSQGRSLALCLDPTHHWVWTARVNGYTLGGVSLSLEWPAACGRNVWVLKWAGDIMPAVGAVFRK